MLKKKNKVLNINSNGSIMGDEYDAGGSKI